MISGRIIQAMSGARQKHAILLNSIDTLPRATRGSCDDALYECFEILHYMSKAAFGSVSLQDDDARLLLTQCWGILDGVEGRLEEYGASKVIDSSADSN